MADKTPWTGKAQMKDPTKGTAGMRSPLNQGHMPPMPKSSNANMPPKK